MNTTRILGMMIHFPTTFPQLGSPLIVLDHLLVEKYVLGIWISFIFKQRYYYIFMLNYIYVYIFPDICSESSS